MPTTRLLPDTSHSDLVPRLRDEQGQAHSCVTSWPNDGDIRFHGGFDAAMADGDGITVAPAIAGG